MKLTRQQVVAIVKALNNGGRVNTNEVSGATGASLVKSGFMDRHFVPDGYGWITTYELTDKAREWARQNGYLT